MKKNKRKPAKYPKSKVLDFDDINNMGISWHEFWVTREGQAVLISNLRETHLENIVKYMEENPGWRSKYKPYIFDEVVRRKREQFIKSSKAGSILYGKKNFL